MCVQSMNTSLGERYPASATSSRIQRKTWSTVSSCKPVPESYSSLWKNGAFHPVRCTPETSGNKCLPLTSSAVAAQRRQSIQVLNQHHFEQHHRVYAGSALSSQYSGSTISYKRSKVHCLIYLRSRCSFGTRLSYPHDLHYIPIHFPRFSIFLTTTSPLYLYYMRKSPAFAGLFSTDWQKHRIEARIPAFYSVFCVSQFSLSAYR